MIYVTDGTNIYMRFVPGVSFFYRRSVRTNQRCEHFDRKFVLLLLKKKVC